VRTADGARTYRATIGEVGLELIQPGTEDSLWRRFLEEKGEGIVHLGFSTDDLEGGTRWCENAGLKTLYKKTFHGGGMTGFDTREHGGAVLELSKYPPEAIAKIEKSRPPYSYVHHVGFVVRSVDEAVKYFEGIGFGPFAPLRLVGERTERTMFGKPTPFRLKNAGAHIGTTKVELEFLQPLESSPVQEEFLEKRGEGANHLGFKVGDVEKEAARLKEKGFDVILTVAFTSGTKCQYIDTRNRGGMLVEFWEPPTAQV
jgi:catechol 2,3-dioxygenase-like lactoylglutathione lyase family enzyme